MLWRQNYLRLYSGTGIEVVVVVVIVVGTVFPLLFFSPDLLNENSGITLIFFLVFMMNIIYGLNNRFS